MSVAISNVKVIVFQLAYKEYAVPVEQVRSIEKLMPFTRVPRTESFVKGVVNLRGLVTPIIDLRDRFELEVTPYDENTRIIIISLTDKEVGLIVDAANDVIDLQSDEIEPQPEVVGTVKAEFISGVAKIDRRLLLLLQLDRILTPLNQG
ncbi:chemotaxis protein CheW [Bacillus coahuilensis p1.1.43]|uniref:Chemotaxis protein CheW n=1 Tax=Bacillus coahuilensis p1.1.43 TaxID=1150625 RepID=A0A147K9K4_9BACI|nr:chemotaxis protein CheW [Bacillus coahuilensis]KUP07128.1 chemotaxis protein CheW [Bacillus coahuilensis p1.1.43]